MANTVSSLILRFAGPAQSWGSGGQLYTAVVQTEQTPTESGVLGLLACCLGAHKKQWPTWVEHGTRVWVRVDRPGEVRTDYQTGNGVPEEMAGHFARSVFAERGKGTVPLVATSTGGAYNISQRKYLANAEFIVAIEHDDHLDDLVAAVTAPVFMPYLGRKAFSPTFPFLLGVSEASAVEVLAEMPSSTDPPRSGSADEVVTLEVYPVKTDRNTLFDNVTVPVTSRKEQLQWASSHLSR